MLRGDRRKIGALLIFYGVRKKNMSRKIGLEHMNQYDL